jgi:hypothetical protein
MATSSPTSTQRSIALTGAPTPTAADDARMARYALKALLAFTLLAKRSMRIAELPAYVERIGVYRDINAAVLRMAPRRSRGCWSTSS